MASPSHNRAVVGRFLRPAAADRVVRAAVADGVVRVVRVDAVFLLAFLKMTKCALPATALSLSDRRATWQPPRAEKASGCCRRRGGRTTNCRRKCYSAASI